MVHPKHSSIEGRQLELPKRSVLLILGGMQGQAGEIFFPTPTMPWQLYLLAEYQFSVGSPRQRPGQCSDWKRDSQPAFYISQLNSANTEVSDRKLK